MIFSESAHPDMSERILAVGVLRDALAGRYQLPTVVRQAIATLDNAEVFRAIDEASDSLLPEESTS